MRLTVSHHLLDNSTCTGKTYCMVCWNGSALLAAVFV